MPNTASAIRKVRVIKTKTLRNQMVKSSLKTAIKSFEASLKQGDDQAKTKAFRYAVKKLDQAVHPAGNSTYDKGITAFCYDTYFHLFFAPFS